MKIYIPQDMKIYIKILTLLTLCYLCNACQLYEEKRKSGTIAEYNGKTITQEQISKITAGLNPQDSARIAQQYIQQWATNLIEYDVAKDQTNKNIEQLVDDYRRSLYLHEYETKLIAQRMPRIIEDTLIQTFYQTHQQHLVLSETIIQGILLVVPNQAPKIDELKKKLQQPEIEENIEWLEKFAYQYAVGYELFTDDWKTTSELFVLMPLEQNNLDKQLKNKRQIEVQDSINTYLLQVTDLYMKGDEKPITYARKEIEEILLRQRQVEFLQQERNKLYENAIVTGKLKLYENE